MNRPSLVVIGGGPVGLAAAIDAHLHGCRVLLVEPKEGVIDKACGEGLMPDAVAALARLGVHPEGRPFVGIRYLQGKLRAEAPLPGGPGLGVRRTRLHAALLARAQSLGLPRQVDRVVAWNQTHDEAIIRLSGGETLRADYVIAADGLHSPTRAALGLDRPPWGAPRIGLRRHFEVEPWTDHVEVYWGPNAEAYITPVSENEVGLAFLTHKRPETAASPPFDRLLQAFPELAHRLGPARSTLRGAGPFEHRSAAPGKGRFLLVGDAAAYLDPLTGEGLKLGLLAAAAAVDCVVQGRVTEYSQRWRALARRPWWATQGLLWIANNRLTRPLILPALIGLPGLMRGALHLLEGGQAPAYARLPAEVPCEAPPQPLLPP